jgi:hypothetical protein
MNLAVITFLFIISNVIATNDNSTSISKFLIHLNSIDKYQFSDNDIIDKLHGKTINIKIGVYNSAPSIHSFGNKHFWI